MTGTLDEKQYTFMILSRSVLLRMQNVQTKFVKIKHIVYSLIFFSFENRAVYEIMWGKKWYSQTGHR
jgi:hypothetical protein